MTTNIKWTPGPWELHPHAVSHVIGPNDRSVANCAGYTHSHDGGAHRFENQANAVLIAAAPELYEALTTLLKESEMSGWMSAGIDAANAALSKARGET